MPDTLLINPALHFGSDDTITYLPALTPFDLTPEQISREYLITMNSGPNGELLRANLQATPGVINLTWEQAHPLNSRPAAYPTLAIGTNGPQQTVAPEPLYVAPLDNYIPPDY